MSAERDSLPQQPIPHLAVVIPALNEASTVRDIAMRALKICSHVVIIDDGSHDATSSSLDGLPVALVRHEKRLGKGAALVSGISVALKSGALAVATMDADGQHWPEHLFKFLDHSSGHPGMIVVGSRMSDEDNIPKLRYLGNRVAAFWISWACGQMVEDSQCGFRLFPRQVLERVSARTGGFVYESEILINACRAGYRISSVQIPAIYNSASRASYYRPWRDTLGIVAMVARSLLARGLYPSGLVASQRERRASKSDSAGEARSV